MLAMLLKKQKEFLEDIDCRSGLFKYMLTKLNIQ